MGQFKAKYPRYVREAITAAVARDMSAKEIAKGLASGKLDGLDGTPKPMADRTVREYVKNAREQIRAGGYSVPEGVTVLDVARGYDALLKELEPEHEQVTDPGAGMPKTTPRYPEGTFAVRWEDGELVSYGSAQLTSLVLEEARELEAAAA